MVAQLDGQGPPQFPTTRTGTAQRIPSTTDGPIVVGATPGTTDSTSTPTTHGALTTESANSGSSSSIPLGAKIGTGVGIAVLLILIGGALFLFIRRKNQKRLLHEKSDVGEEMIGGGKVHPDEDLNSEPSPAAHSGTPPQAPDGHVYAPPAMQGGYGQGEAAVPVVAPVARRSVDEEDFMHRPVSPVHDDDLMTEVAPVHTAGRSATALGGSIRERGEPNLGPC